MTADEFAAAIRSYGLKPPVFISGTWTWWLRRWGMPDVGSGNHHDYSTYHLRCYVAHELLRKAGGSLNGPHRPGRLRRYAEELFAEHDYGWVVMSEGAVWWQPDPPIDDLARGVGALACS